MNTYLIIASALVLANFCWSDARFALFSSKTPKPTKHILQEWSLGFVVFIAISRGLEFRENGVLHEQGWEFAATALLLFTLAAVPGFVYQRLLRPMIRK